MPNSKQTNYCHYDWLHEIVLNDYHKYVLCLWGIQRRDQSISIQQRRTATLPDHDDGIKYSPTDVNGCYAHLNCYKLNFNWSARVFGARIPYRNSHNAVRRFAWCKCRIPVCIMPDARVGSISCPFSRRLSTSLSVLFARNWDQKCRGKNSQFIMFDRFEWKLSCPFAWQWLLGIGIWDVSKSNAYNSEESVVAIRIAAAFRNFQMNLIAWH